MKMVSRRNALGGRSVKHSSDSTVCPFPIYVSSVMSRGETEHMKNTITFLSIPRFTFEDLCYPLPEQSKSHCIGLISIMYRQAEALFKSMELAGQCKLDLMLVRETFEDREAKIWWDGGGQGSRFFSNPNQLPL